MLFAEARGRCGLGRIARFAGTFMAVYTDVAAEDLSRFLAGYDIGALLSYKGIAEGVENSNFLVHTAKGHFILTLYERRVAERDLPFFLGLMEHLAGRGINCPQPVKDRAGKVLGKLAGRPAAIVTFLDGMWIRRPSAAHCGALGESLARLHLAGADFAMRRDNALSVAASARTRSTAIWRRWLPPNWPCWNASGRAACRRASFMPICFRTTCFSSATSCQG